MLQELEQAELSAESIHVDQQSLIANTNFAGLLRIQAGIRLLTASVRASLARNEFRGVHQRSDFLEENSSYSTILQLIMMQTSAHWL